MLRRVVENVVVAIIASVVTWAMSNPGDSSGAADAVIERLLSGVASFGRPLGGWLWLTAIALVVVGITLQILSMAPARPNASWEWSVSMPSLLTTLMGVGVALGVTAKAVNLAEEASLWALPLLAVVVFWTYRWTAPSATAGPGWRAFCDLGPRRYKRQQRNDTPTQPALTRLTEVPGARMPVPNFHDPTRPELDAAVLSAPVATFRAWQMRVRASIK